MKSFLLKNNHPTIKWSMLPDNIFFEGVIPEGYDLAVCPSGNYIVLDVDVKGDKNGFEHIPSYFKAQLDTSFYYDTKSGGRHYWLEYTGDKYLLNKATKYGLDLRVGAKGKNAGGYVKYVHPVDIRQCIHLIKKTSPDLNEWLEGLFSNKV
jgi:hypothetical protein